MDLSNLLDKILDKNFDVIYDDLENIDIFDIKNEEILDNSDIICYTNCCKDYINHKINE